MILRVIPLATLLLAACGDFPNLETPAPDDTTQQGFLQLAPIDQLTARGDILTVSEDTTETLQERVQRLKDRAEGLRSPVLSDAEKDRLEADLFEGLPEDG
ncbi:MAG: hypothetical protein AAGK92_08785 [Pseudomonadota bacterium]